MLVQLILGMKEKTRARTFSACASAATVAGPPHGRQAWHQTCVIPEGLSSNEDAAFLAADACHFRTECDP